MSRMTEIIALSQKELSRARILTLVVEGHVSVLEAAKSMGLSRRQARRLLGRFKEAGAAGLAHGNRGRPASNRLAAKTRQRVLELVKKKYAGFNDTHLCEVLASGRRSCWVGRPCGTCCARRGWVRSANVVCVSTVVVAILVRAAA